MSLIDWLIIIISVVVLRVISLSTRKYMKGVADFLVANRCAGRYLLTIGSQMGSTGAISIVAFWEMYSQAGVTPIWWTLMNLPVTATIVLTGWIYYRFRETRAMTMAQFLEMRYSKRFRVFAGLMCFTSGMLNFGIFPAVAARFFMYFCGLPEYFHAFGLPFAIPTFPVIMAIDLALALTFVTMGGQVSVMITEVAQGMFCTFAFIVLAAAVLLTIHWPRIIEALNMAASSGAFIHPYHTSKVKDFNMWYFLIGVFGMFYNHNSWLGGQAYQASARSPHEQKMGLLIAVWRLIPQTLATVLLGVAGLTIMIHPEFVAKAAYVNQALSHIGNETIRTEMRVPMALASVLPIGIKGLLATIMLFASFTCHDTYMHSWGSIFIQDVYMPFRKKAITPEEHIRLLRWSIIGVGVFAFLFSLFYPMSNQVFMFFAITGAIWLGGSGAVIAGGLYWKRGTTAGAFSAIIVGTTVGLCGLIIPPIYKAHMHSDFPINGQWMLFGSMISGILVYTIVSLLTGGLKHEYNLDKLLHRGKYALADQPKVDASLHSRWQRLVGITNEFTVTDKILAFAVIGWNFGWFTFFIVMTVLNAVLPNHFSVNWWSNFWHIYLISLFVLSIPICAWFTIGGVMDIKHLLHSLATTVRDTSDDGRVQHSPDCNTVPDAEAELEKESPLAL